MYRRDNLMGLLVVRSTAMAKKNAKNWWERLKDRLNEALEAAPPVTRKFDEGYVLLGRNDEHGKFRPVGAFSAELYVMAQAGRLPCQIEKRPELYRRDGHEKTPMELAMIPHKGHNQIAKYFIEMITFKDKSRAVLPAPVFKYRIIEEFLQTVLAKTAFKLYKDDRKSSVDDVKINLRNPGNRTSRREQVLHYASQWMAIFLGVEVGLGLAASLGFGFPWSILPFVGGYLAHKCAKDFGMFDLVEGILRDWGWMFDRTYAWSGKLSPKKALETSVYVLSILGMVGLAGQSAWAAIVGMSWWSLLPAALLAGGIVPAIVAAPFALAAGVGTWLGFSYATRFFWAFSIYDNTISVKDAEQAVRHVPFADLAGRAEMALAESLCDKMRSIGRTVDISSEAGYRSPPLRSPRSLLAEFESDDSERLTRNKWSRSSHR